MAAKWKKSKFPNLYRRDPAGTYYIRVQVHGKVISRSLKTKDLKEARLLAMNQLTEILKKPQGQSGKVAMSVREAFEAASRYYESESLLKKASKKSLGCISRRMIEWWPHDIEASASTITEARIRTCLAGLVKQYSPTYIKTILVVIRKAASFGIEAGLIHEDPTQKIKVEKPNPKNVEVPTKQKIEELFRVISEEPDPRLKQVVQTLRFLVYGGFRWHESTLIQWSDVGPTYIRVHRETKSGKPRTVPIIGQMEQLIEELMEEYPCQPGDRIIQAKYDLCGKVLAWACGKVGINKLTPHDLRHIFTTSCLDSGVDIPTVSAWLGHQDGGVLVGKLYGHRRNEHMENMAKKVEV